MKVEILELLALLIWQDLERKLDELVAVTSRRPVERRKWTRKWKREKERKNLVLKVVGNLLLGRLLLCGLV